jgi:hypothetical protein
MTTAAAIRRPATVLGAILAALTLTGPAWGQTVLDGVGSTVEGTTEAVQPVTDAVEDTAAQATAPATNSQPAQSTEAVEAVGSTAGAATQTATAATGAAVKTATGTAANATKAVTTTAKTVTSTATKAAAPLAKNAADTVTRTLESTTGALPSATQTLLGPLVDTIDTRAEELLGPGATSAPPALGSTPPAAWSPEELTAATPLSTDGPTRPRTGSDRGRGVAGPPADWLSPAPAWSGPVSGATPAESPPERGHVPVPDGPTGAPAAPFSAGAMGAGFSAALAVLAGLLAFALAASLGRLQLWSDLIRPLAFVSPPDRPG